MKVTKRTEIRTYLTSEEIGDIIMEHLKASGSIEWDDYHGCVIVNIIESEDLPSGGSQT